jgi:hypothetical protein
MGSNQAVSYRGLFIYRYLHHSLNPQIVVKDARELDYLGPILADASKQD